MAVESMVADGIELVVIDIAEQEDLKRLCLGLSHSNLKVVYVGSTGLAEFVPLAFNVDSMSIAVHQERSVDRRPALALVGSASETTRRQLQVAQTKNQLKIIQLDPTHVIQNGQIASVELEKTEANLRAFLASGHDAALVVNSSRDEIAKTQQLGARLNLSASQVAQRIVDWLAQAGSRLVSEGRIGGIEVADHPMRAAAQGNQPCRATIGGNDLVGSIQPAVVAGRDCPGSHHHHQHVNPPRAPSSRPAETTNGAPSEPRWLRRGAPWHVLRRLPSPA